MLSRACRACLIAGWLVAVGLGGCATRAEQRFEFARVCMGVRARIVVYGADSARATSGAAAAFEELARLDAMMSDYRADSELSRLGSTHGAWTPLSPELREVLTRAQGLAAETDGAFDVTVGPCVALWRAARRTGVMADEHTLAEALARCGSEKLELGPQGARLAVAGMKLDLGGIAKGYAAERAGNVLTRHGLPRHLVALAGDVWAGQAPPGRDGWSVEVRGERTGDDAPALGVLLLTSAAVSTSGDAEQEIEVGGRRYSHLMDPRTGLGCEASRSVTVVAAHGMDADAVATALCVLGPGHLERVARREDVAVLLVPGDSGPPVTMDPQGLFRWEGRPGRRSPSVPDR